MIALLLTALASAATPAYPATLMGGLGGMAAPPSVGGYGVGRLLLSPPGSPVSVVFAGREGYAVADARTVGAIGVDAHWQSARGAFVRGGFAHHHEVPWDLAMANPVQASLGSLTGIRHRSGLEVGVGWDVPISERTLGDRLGFVIDLGLSVFPDDHGPPLYLFLEQCWSIDVGKRRE